MTLHIESGHPTQGDVAQIGGNLVRFVTEDGRCMFEVTIGSDGTSIDVRGAGRTKVDGELYSEAIQVRPIASNAITVHVCRHTD
jgi:hypothetical protein